MAYPLQDFVSGLSISGALFTLDMSDLSHTQLALTIINIWWLLVWALINYCTRETFSFTDINTILGLLLSNVLPLDFGFENRN